MSPVTYQEIIADPTLGKMRYLIQNIIFAMKTEYLILIGTLGGTFIAATASVITTWINKRSEDHRHLRTLMVNAGIEYWKQHYQMVKDQKVQTQIQPLAGYMLSMTILGDLCIKSSINEKNIFDKLSQAVKLTHIAEKYIQESQRSET